MSKLLQLFCLLFLATTLNGFCQVIALNSQDWEFANNRFEFGLKSGKEAVRLNDNRMQLKGKLFKNSIIEFDVLFDRDRAFVGIAFRMADKKNYEEFYLRPHQSGNPDANQYSPVFNGLSAWQLYTGAGFCAPIQYHFQSWIHCKLVIVDQIMEVFIDDMSKPAIVSSLRRAPVEGGISLFSTLGESWFSNLTIQSAEKSAITSTPLVKQNMEGVIDHWSISNSFPESIVAGNSIDTTFLKRLHWRTHQAEADGLVNLAEHSEWSQKNNTVFLRLSIESDNSSIQRMTYGFSDRVMIFLNGKIIVGGNDGYRTRDYRFLGTIGYFDEVFLHLSKGENELLIAVSEELGGWGFQGKITDRNGIRLLTQLLKK